jgi:excisionase family DNA binding protein
VPPDRACYTPPEFARRLRVGEDKVRRWIETGRLRAVNVASDGCRRPRYRIPVDAVLEFEAARAAVPAAPTGRWRRTAATGVIEFF